MVAHKPRAQSDESRRGTSVLPRRSQTNRKHEQTDDPRKPRLNRLANSANTSPGPDGFGGRLSRASAEALARQGSPRRHPHRDATHGSAEA